MNKLALSLTLLWAVLWLPALTLATEDDALDVLIELPVFGEAVFGEVEVGADIYPPEADISRVEFYLDSRVVGVLDRPPYRLAIDAGQENVEHQFQVVVYDTAGTTATSSVWTPRIETDDEITLDLQQLYVTVERFDERVLDLSREDFAVMDNSARQQLVTFERGDVPFTAVLLVDASTSMKGRRLRIALEGAEAFVRGMRELDQAKLMLFSDRVIHETPFTTFASVLTVGLAGVEAEGGTALNDHLYLAMKRLQTRQGRRVMVVLSDGIDVESVMSMAQVRWSASQLQPVVYWIRLEERPRHQSMWRGPDEHEHEHEQFHEMALESGGRIETIHRIEDVGQAFRSILEDLRNQYVLGYYPPKTASKDAWHKILVRVPDPTLTVRARGSYLEPTRWNGNRRF